MDSQSSYTFIRSKRSFSYFSPTRPQVQATLSPGESYWIIQRPDIQYYTQFVPVYDFHGLKRELVRAAFIDWKSPPGKKPFRDIQIWVRKRSALALSSRMYQEWNRIIADIQARDPVWDRVLRRLFSVAFADAVPIYGASEIMSVPYLAQDILRYRPLAVLMTHAWARTPLQDIKPFVRGVTALDLHKHWMEVYAHGPEVTRSLRRTLANWPGGISPLLYAYLPLIRLERPLTDRIELMFQLLFARNLVYHDLHQLQWKPVPPTARRVIHFATRQDILQEVWAANPNADARFFRRKEAYSDLASDLADFAGEYYGTTLSSLVQANLEFHRQRVRQQGGYPPEQPTVRPTIPLPSQEGITFLDSVGAMQAESERMHHCVGYGGYPSMAVAGTSFFFHIEVRGHHATAQVTSQGVVTQVRGPANRDNPACEWGRIVLTEWAKGLCGSLKETPKPVGLRNLFADFWVGENRQEGLAFPPDPV